MEGITHLTRGRRRLAKVAAAAGPLVDVAVAARTLELDSRSAVKQLACWHEQGLLRRLRRGMYAVVPPAAAIHESVIADPWLFVSKLYREIYVGGWSAAEHWELTEQLCDLRVFNFVMLLSWWDCRRSKLSER